MLKIVALCCIAWTGLLLTEFSSACQLSAADSKRWSADLRSNNETRNQAAFAWIRQTGLEAMPVILKGLRNANPLVRRELPRLLAEFGVPAEEALITAWRKAPKRKEFRTGLAWVLLANPDAGEASAKALSEIESDSEMFLPLSYALTIRTGGASPYLVNSALTGGDREATLAGMAAAYDNGPKAQETLKSLMGAQHDDARLQLYYGIARRNLVGDPWTPFLVEESKDKGNMGALALWALIQTGQELEYVLNAYLAREDFQVTLDKCFDQAGARIQMPLLDVLVKPSAPKEVRRVAGRQLADVEGLSEEVWQEIAPMIMDPSIDVDLLDPLIRIIQVKEVCGPEMVPGILRVLKDGGPSSRSVACSVVASHKLDTKEIRTELASALKSSDEQIVPAAAYALGSLGVQTQHEFDVLVAALGDRNDKAKQWVAFALGSMAPEFAERGSQVLKELVEKDEEPETDRPSGLSPFDLRLMYRFSVLDALEKLDAPGARVLDGFLSDPIPVPWKNAYVRWLVKRDCDLEKVETLLNDGHPSVVLAAGLVLAEAESADEEVVKAMIRVMQYDDDAVTVLGGMGPRALAAKAALLKALKEGRGGDLRFESAKALGLIAPGDRAVIKAYQKIWKDKKEGREIKRGCAIGARNMGKEGKAMIRDLIQLQKDYPRSLAFDACVSIDSASKRLITALTKLVKPGGKGLDAVRACEALAQCGEAATKSLPAVLNLHREGNSIEQEAVLSVLVVIGPTSERALDDVAWTMLYHPKLRYRKAAIEWIQSLDEGGIGVLPQLVRSAQHWTYPRKSGYAIASPDGTPGGRDRIYLTYSDDDWLDVRLAAIEAIADLGQAATPAKAALQRMSADPFPEIRAASLKALENL